MKNHQRQYSLLDHLCLGVDQALRAIAGEPKATTRVYPAKALPDADLSPEQSRYAAGLMRVNHAGEVCAQALYHAQALVSRDARIQAHMREAAQEEGDHLSWCQTRLLELSSHTSYLNPIWYTGSFAIGLAAGLVGDKWSLGFVAETETQVVRHLESHLRDLPPEDVRSICVLEKMREDEAKHKDEAIQAGAAELPGWVKRANGVDV